MSSSKASETPMHLLFYGGDMTGQQEADLFEVSHELRAKDIKFTAIGVDRFIYTPTLEVNLAPDQTSAMWFVGHEAILGFANGDMSAASQPVEIANNSVS